MSLADVAAVVGAQQAPTGTVTGAVRIDSREVGPGDLFVALVGERSDGHDFAPGAIGSGAAAVVVERATTERDLVVPDALVALQALARTVFAIDQPLTFGITGSSGKTSTKDLLAQVLGGFGETLAPAGSFNNEIGLPLTATRRTADTQYAVLEYSARGIGHIGFLCGIVRPHVAIVLNVGSAHLGEFGSVDNIATAKGELVEAATSLAVLNADDPLVLGMSRRTAHPIVTFGTGPAADYRAEDVTVDSDGRASFRLQSRQGSAAVRMQLRGEHQVSNALAVSAAVLGSGVTSDVGAVARLLGEAKALSRWRMEVTERPDGVTVVNDAYNANPESMRAALRTLATMGRDGERRTWAVLGPMAELGDDADEAHVELGRFARRLAVSRLVVIGSAAAGIHAGAVEETGSGGAVVVEDVEAAAELLRQDLRPGDVVLVKASRAAALERVAEALLADPA